MERALRRRRRARLSCGRQSGTVPRVIALQAAAFASSLLHALVDVWIGLLGGGRAIQAGEAATLVSIALLYAWWALLFSFAARRDALWGLLALAALLAAFANGAIGFAFCLPPCAGAAPLGDLSHLGSLGFGAWAAVATWRAMRSAREPRGLGVLGVTAALMLASFVLGATNVTLP